MRISQEATGTAWLLAAWRRGDEEALAELLRRVYDELCRIASNYLRQERPGHTLQTSALVHEAYLRLIDQDAASWRNRAHFLGIAARMMRRVLVDHARYHGYAKRGGGALKVSFDEEAMAPAVPKPEILELDLALSELAELDPEQARLVELRYFGGLKVDELAVVLGISISTVTRKWSLAKAWLYRRLVQEGAHGP